jgi:hypothetical protein
VDEAEAPSVAECNVQYSNSIQQQQQDGYGWKHLHVSFFVCRLHDMTFFCKHGPCLVDGVSTLSDANRSSCDVTACTQPIAQQHYATDHHQLISVTLVPTG